MAAAAKKFAIKRRKEPRLRFRPIAQLMTFRRPKKKCLLRQIGCVGFRSRQAEGKTKQGLILSIHQLLKIRREHI